MSGLNSVDHERVVIIGSGPAGYTAAIYAARAMVEPPYLRNSAWQVPVVHRRDSFRAEKILQDRLLRRENVEVKWNRTIEEVLGGGEPLGVTGARVHNLKTGAREIIEADGLFV